MAKKRKFSLKRTILLTVVGDALLLAVSLLTFAYFHHVRIEPSENIGKRVLATPTPAPTPEPTEEPTPQPAEEAVFALSPTSSAEPALTPEPTATPEPTPDTGILNGKYAEKFTDGEIVRDDNGYRSANVSIAINQQFYKGSNCITADIYIKDISSFKTAVYDQFGRTYMATLDMADEVNAIVALSGDHFYQHRQNGVFAVRNGVIYADNPNKRQDVCVLYRDGTMVCYDNKSIDVTAIEEQAPLHVWYFGPSLLDADGHALSSFPNSSVTGVNPRSAIGYFEPGHYVFVMVEGRQDDSPGLTLAELAQFFEDLGCECAYNLDGGQSAVITYNGKVVSRIHHSGRDISDILYIVEPDA